jgi:hypothetical protein
MGVEYLKLLILKSERVLVLGDKVRVNFGHNAATILVAGKRNL